MKEYLTFTTSKDGKQVQTNLGSFEYSGSPTYQFDCQAAMTRSADQKFGPGNWRFKTDSSLAGCYAVGPNGDTIHVDPFPVAPDIDPPLPESP